MSTCITYWLNSLVNAGVTGSCSIMNACIIDAICPIGFSLAVAVDLYNPTGSGDLFNLAALPDLAAVSVAVNTAVTGFKLNGCCELLTPAERAVGSLTLPSYKFINEVRI